MSEESQILEPIKVDGPPPSSPLPGEERDIGPTGRAGEGDSSSPAPPPASGGERVEAAVSLDAPIADLKAQVAALDTIAKKFAAVGNSLVAADAASESLNRVRDALLDKVEASRPSFQFQLIRPFVQRLANFSDSITDWSRGSLPTDAEGFAKCLDAIAKQMRDILALHGVVEVRPAEGDALDPRSHFVAEAKPTADPALHEKVAVLLEHGYQYIGPHDRSGMVTATLIRPARVVTWKHDPTLGERGASAP